MRIVANYESDSFLTLTKSSFSARFDAAKLRAWLEIPTPEPASLRKHRRVYPWISRTAHTEEIICKLHLPQGYELAHTPSETHQELPHGKTEMLFNESNGIPCLTLRVIRQPARLQPEELPDVAQQVDRAISRVRASLDIEESATSLMREHRYAKAEAAIVDAARRETNSIDALMRLGTYYKTVGRVFQSQLAFEKAISLAPQDPRGYELLADTYSGWLGVPGEGFDRQSIMAVFDRAFTNLPNRAWTINQRANICLISDMGRGESTNNLNEAEGFYRELLKEDTESYKGLFGLARVSRLRGKYDEAENYYRKAARLKPDLGEPLAGIWVSMAYAGYDEQAWNAITAYCGATQERNAEVVRVASLLTSSRRYAEAVKLYDRLSDSITRPDVLQKILRTLRKAEKVKKDNYDNFYDDTSPETLAQTLLVATFKADTNRLFHCLSPAINHEEAMQWMQRQAREFKSRTAIFDTNCSLDMVLAGCDLSRHTLDNGDVEVRLEFSNLTSANNSVPGLIAIRMQSVSNHWQAITLNDVEVDCATYGRLAMDALDRGDTTNALEWQSRMVELMSRPPSAGSRPSPSWVKRVQEMAFSNDVLRVKTWAGLGLAHSQNRPDMKRGIRCLEDVVAVYPGDHQIKLVLAAADMQVANVRKAAAILETINISEITLMDELMRMAGMLLELEKVDQADQIVRRTRELAPNDPLSLSIQAQIQLYRAKYNEALTIVERLRDISKQDTRYLITAESTAISLSGKQDALRELIERCREPQKPLGALRHVISQTCLALNLPDESYEQSATMLDEGASPCDVLANYAAAALARGDTAEARHLVSVADRFAKHSGETDNLLLLAQTHFALGDFADAARLYREYGMRHISKSSGYNLCMSALFSQLAGETASAAESLKVAAVMQGDGDWPRLAIQYVNWTITEEEFRQAPALTTTTPLMHASRECEVKCIIALLKEGKHDLPSAIAAYKDCVATKSVTDLEYTIAKLGLQRLDKGNQAKGEDKRAGI